MTKRSDLFGEIFHEHHENTRKYRLLLETVMFYADPVNHYRVGEEPSTVDIDNGHRARVAMEQLTNINKEMSPAELQSRLIDEVLSKG